MGTEQQLEKRFVDVAKRRGAICPKFEGKGENGWPDRLLLTPHGEAVFVELKASGEKPRRLQDYRHRQLRERGFHVYTCDRWEDALGILDEHLPA